MTFVSNSIKVKEPDYFHRDYKNDLKIADPKKASEAVNQGLRIAKAALPFVALYKPVGSLLSVVMGGCRIISNASQTYQSYSEGKGRLTIASELLQTTVAVVSVGCAFFALPLGMLVITSHDLAMNCIQLYQAWQEKDSAKAREAGLQILSNAVYFGLFFTASLEVLVASFALQILAGLYQTSGEFQKGNYLEVGAGLLMVAVRMNQAVAPVRELHHRWKVAIENKRQVIVSCNIAKADLTNSKISATNENGASEVAQLIIKYTEPHVGGPAIFHAAKAGDEYAVKKLLAHGGSSKDALHGAISGKQMSLVKHLVETVKVQSDNVWDFINLNDGWEVFNYFVQRGLQVPYAGLLNGYFIYPNIIRQLVLRGGKFDVENTKDFWKNRWNFFKDDFDRNLRCEIINAYSAASGIPLNEYFDVNGYLEKASWVSKNGRLLGARAITGNNSRGHQVSWAQKQCTPLQFAVLSNDLDLAEALLKAGANPDFERSMVLQMAKNMAQEVGLQMMSLLIRYGAKVDGV